MGPGGAMEPKRFRSLQDLTSFLKELKIDPAAQRLAIADLERTETATIPNILLTMAELHELWPIQFSEKSRGGRNQNPLVCCNIQFLTMGTGHCLVVGVRLAVPSWFGRAMKMKRVRQAVPLQPGRQSRWPIVKS